MPQITDIHLDREEEILEKEQIIKFTSILDITDQKSFQSKFNNERSFFHRQTGNNLYLDESLQYQEQDFDLLAKHNRGKKQKENHLRKNSMYMEFKNNTYTLPDTSQILDSIEEEYSDDIISSKQNKFVKRYEILDQNEQF